MRVKSLQDAIPGASAARAREFACEHYGKLDMGRVGAAHNHSADYEVFEAWLDGATQTAIARAMGVSREMVNMRLHRVLDWLKAHAGEISAEEQGNARLRLAVWLGLGLGAGLLLACVATQLAMAAGLPVAVTNALGFVMLCAGLAGAITLGGACAVSGGGQ